MSCRVPKKRVIIAIRGTKATTSYPDGCAVCGWPSYMAVHDAGNRHIPDCHEFTPKLSEGGGK